MIYDTYLVGRERAQMDPLKTCNICVGRVHINNVFAAMFGVLRTFVVQYIPKINEIIFPITVRRAL